MEPERSAASLAMQSHHILFWSCRHWGSPLSPLLTIRTCHWIPFKKTPIFPQSLRPYRSAFSFLPFFFFLSTLLLHLPPATPTLIAFQKMGTLWWLHLSFLFLKMKRGKKADPIQEVLVVREHTSFPCLLFFLFSSSPS